MQNYLWFPNKHPKSESSFIDTMKTADLSALAGVVFSIHPDMIADNDFSEIDFVLDNIPSRMNIQIGMPASSLEASKTYPFKTVAIQTSAGGMIVPVISDSNFFAWMLVQWRAVYTHLEGRGAGNRLTSICFSPLGEYSGDGQFHVPGDVNNNPIQNVSFWANLGVTEASVITNICSFLKTLSASLPQTIKYVFPILCPYNSFLGSVGVGDQGKSFTALEKALQAVTSNYVTIDQTLKYPDERSIIRSVSTGHPYCCQIATIPGNQTEEIINSYKLALSYNPQWVEWQMYMIDTLTTWIKTQT